MRTPTVSRFVVFTLIAATVAALVTAASVALALPIWAMFVGWVAYYTKPTTLRDGLVNLGCTVLGVFIGLLAATGSRVLSPLLGPATLPVVVFIVACVVVSLRSAPVVNNVLCYFLGLISYFAGHAPTELRALATLFFAFALGSLGAFGSARLQARVLAQNNQSRFG